MPQEWLQNSELPDELKGNETLNRYDSLEAAMNGFLETRAAASQSIRVPTKEAGAEAREQFLQRLITMAPELTVKPNGDNTAEFYKVMGRPDDAAGYEAPQEMPYDIGKDVEGQLRDVALKMNLTKDQFKVLLTEMGGMRKATMDGVEQARKADQDALKAEWGAAYDERVAAAKKVNEELFPKVDFNRLPSQEIKARYEIHSRLNDGKATVAGQQGAQSARLTPEEAQRRAQEIMNNPDYWDSSSPNQAALMKQHHDLLVEAGFSTDLSRFSASPFSA